MSEGVSNPTSRCCCKTAQLFDEIRPVQSLSGFADNKLQEVALVVRSASGFELEKGKKEIDRQTHRQVYYDPGQCYTR